MEPTTLIGKARKRILDLGEGKEFSILLIKDLSPNPSHLLRCMEELGDIQRTPNMVPVKGGKPLLSFINLSISQNNIERERGWSKSKHQAASYTPTKSNFSTDGWERVFPEYFYLSITLPIIQTKFYGERYL